MLLFMLIAFSLPGRGQERITIPDFYDSSSCSIDSSARLFIEEITVKGNKKTKSYIILREMVIKQGDSLIAGQIYAKMEESRQLVYNTALFTSVEIKPSFAEPKHVTLTVTVTEKWYIYPLPQFQLADRNFNEWLNVYNADLNRVIYGLRFVHYNFSGRKDQLRIVMLNGYSRNISFSYNNPYSNRKLTEGFSFGMGYTQNREVTYMTGYDNKIRQFQNGSFVRNIFSVFGSYQIRKGYYKRNVISAGYSFMNITDSIITKYNPDYFGNQDATTGFTDIAFGSYYTNVDMITYPLKGNVRYLVISKRGLGLKGANNFFGVDGSYSRYVSHGKDWYSSVNTFARIRLPFKQPYINRQALGYRELFLRGQEYYVIDGVATVLGKYTLKKKVTSFKIPMPFKIKSVPNLPFTIFAKTYGDIGYCYSQPETASMLNNRFLYSGGAGLDFLIVYDFSIRVEYSFNQLGEKGLFLHFKGGF